MTTQLSDEEAFAPVIDVARETDHRLNEAMDLGDEASALVQSRAKAAGLPPISVSAAHGKFLSLVARMSGARTAVEVGTLGGYSTLWISRGLATGGHVVSIEIDPHHAQVARESLALVNPPTVCEIIEGSAHEVLPTLAQHTAAPFDMAFLDADKVSNPTYLAMIKPMLNPGAVVVVDNVIRHLVAARHGEETPSSTGSREVLQMLADDPDFEAVALQTVGAKGWDGLALARLK